MNFLNVIGSSVFQILSIVFVFSYLLGIINIYFSDKNDYCVMTYMYEYPQFVRISVPENAMYPQYGLYAYSEGRFTERARKMWFNGVPVLFLPGNSGSHMQARSLASVALRKALDKANQDFHFDYFTISYNEELSGLYGGVLQSQTSFAASCISKILSLYKSNKYTKNIPTSVILIGHSMGGLIAKRLLAYSDTVNSTTIAIALAAPLQAPVLNIDFAMNNYYKIMEFEWDIFVHSDETVKNKKLLLSFGNGARDVLMPSALTSTNDSFIDALTTAIPGVWVSPDHVSIVWCKQVVMAVNRFLFSIIDPVTNQLSENSELWKSNAKTYFQANRSMVLSPDLPRGNVTMQADAFWYEDSRRMYQITRPEIDRMTYLMIRLVTFPQNRFLAIEAINLADKDWIFGCNAMYTYGTYRYCKQATSMSEVSRWTGAATNFGKRKLATINLHTLKDDHPDWSHVIVKVSPSRKPLVLNVDVNDYASRVKTVDLPSDFAFGQSVIIQETEANSLYYELNLPGFNTVHQAYLLYVEPTPDCKASQYHVSAEMHVPWAKDHEFFHYFTPSKRSPMKLRLFTSNMNVTYGLEPLEPVKVTLLLDPQCTYTISISSSWYNRLAQLARNYSPMLVPYVAAIVVLAARSSLSHLREQGSFLSIHSALMSDGVMPYYGLVFSRLLTMAMLSLPIKVFLVQFASWSNLEMQYFTRSLLVLPAYMTALGILNVVAAAVLAVMVFSSQLAHRLLFRIVWRGGPSFAENVASGLQKVPMVVSAAIVGAVPLSCGAASLAVGAAFYAFMISKMYEEYLEDYVYKLMAKVICRLRSMFKSKKGAKSESETSLVPKEPTVDKYNSDSLKSIEDNKNSVEIKEENKNTVDNVDSKKGNITHKEDSDNKTVAVIKSTKRASRKKKDLNKENKTETGDEGDMIVEEDDDLNNLNFHVMMFFLWMCVTLVNLPALLTWARNFKHSAVLKPDTSYHTGFVMSVCSACIWQMEGPRKNLSHHESISALLFTMAVFILALGPFSLTIVNYGVTFIFTAITLQQLFDKEEKVEVVDTKEVELQENAENSTKEDDTASEQQDEKGKEQDEESDAKQPENLVDESDVCNENRIFTMFKNLRDKFSRIGEET